MLSSLRVASGRGKDRGCVREHQPQHVKNRTFCELKRGITSPGNAKHHLTPAPPTSWRRGRRNPAFGILTGTQNHTRCACAACQYEALTGRLCGPVRGQNDGLRAVITINESSRALPRMIRILELEASLGWGGQEKRTARLINHLNPQEFEVWVAAPPGAKLLAQGPELRAHTVSLPMKSAASPSALWALARLIRREKITLLSTHSGKDGWLGALAGKLTGRPVIRTRHLQTPISSTVSYNLSTRVVTVSGQVAEHLKARGVRPEKLRVIYTGVDTQRFCPASNSPLRQLIGASSDDVLVGILAVLRSAKRHKDLLAALRQLPEHFKLVFIGDGPQAGNLRREIDALGLQSRVYMMGHRDDGPALLPGLDILSLPSEAEALGTALLEGASCGLPTLATRVGGIPECVLDGQTGFLVAPGDVAALAEKMRLMGSDRALRQRLGQAGRRLIEERFSVQTMVQQTEALYREVAGQYP